MNQMQKQLVKAIYLSKITKHDGGQSKNKKLLSVKTLQNHSFVKRIISLLELLFIYDKKVVVISSREKITNLEI